MLATAPSAIRRLAPVFSEIGVPQTLRTVAAAGEPLTATVASSWESTGAPIVRNGYGLSEVGMVLGDAFGPGPTARPGMLTHPIPGFDPFLVGPDGSPSLADEPRLIAVRRPRHQMSAGYENAPAQWQQSWHGEVFVTEDRARIDGEGRWMIEGRADDMIITSGHNVSPVEVEDAILKHPAITEAAAVAYADHARGDVVRAVVVAPQPGIDVDELTRQLKDLVAQHVGKYASPRVVTFVDALPRNEVGKLRRASLRPQ